MKCCADHILDHSISTPNFHSRFEETSEDCINRKMHSVHRQISSTVSVCFKLLDLNINWGVGNVKLTLQRE